MAMSFPMTTGGHEPGFAVTHRADRWWVGPVATVLGLLAFVVYTTWAALQGEHYYVGSYLSPFYSPVLLVDAAAAGAAPLGHAWIGAFPSWWPALIPASPAILILMFPASFRMTCYYYRKAYYRSFSATPPACSVGALPQKNYKGETAFLLFQNLHRYALPFAVALVVILTYDALYAFQLDGEIGVGVGTIILLINAVLIGGYTFGCHSFRHLVGGCLNSFSSSAAARLRHGAWSGCTALNGRHMAWAWASLVWVMISDLYVRLVSMGIITDINTWS